MYFDTLQTVFGCDSIISTVLFNSCLDIQAVSPMNNVLNVFPNPSAGVYFVNIPKEENVLIVVLDLNSKVILRKKVSNNVTSRIDLSKYEDGVYFIQVFCENEIYTNKVIKN